jgi:hypothetical protein
MPLAPRIPYFRGVSLTALPSERIYVNVNNIHTEGRTLMHLVATLDDYGKPAWIAATILGFIVWWPIGLGVLAYLIWSGRMGCGNQKAWRSYFNDEARRFRSGFTATGNHAFDEYREETLKRLEEEAKEFQGFLKRLRHAKDKAEFDQFMAERRQSSAPTAV